MRITVVMQDLYDTGANRVTVDRAARWQAAGDEVTIFVTGHEQEPGQVPLPPGLRIRRGTRRPRQLRESLPIALWNLIRQARRSDVVVAGTEVGFGLLLGSAAARLAHRPLAVTVQSRADVAIQQYVEGWLRPATRFALTHADLAVCVSNGLAPSLVELGLPVDRVAVVPNAVPRAELLVAAAQAPDVPLNDVLPTLVTSGRLVRQKGFDLLVRAHGLALAAGAPPHHLIILGEGEERATLHRQIEELGLQESVTVPGFSTNPHAVVARASLFVLSSRWEGFSLSLAEALACGTACVAFDCVSGPAEVLAGGRYGELVPAEDVEALARAITDHLIDPASLRERARRAADEAVELFSPDLAAERHRSAVTALAR